MGNAVNERINANIKSAYLIDYEIAIYRDHKCTKNERTWKKSDFGKTTLQYIRRTQLIFRV